MQLSRFSVEVQHLGHTIMVDEYGNPISLVQVLLVVRVVQLKCDW